MFLLKVLANYYAQHDRLFQGNKFPSSSTALRMVNTTIPFRQETPIYNLKSKAHFSFIPLFATSTKSWDLEALFVILFETTEYRAKTFELGFVFVFFTVDWGWQVKCENFKKKWIETKIGLHSVLFLKYRVIFT